MGLNYLALTIIIPFILNFGFLLIGLSVLKISKVTIKQVVFYSVAGIIMTNIVNYILGNIIIKPNTQFIFIYIYYGTAFVLTYFLIKYILKLKGKELRSLFWYFVAVNLILYFLSNFSAIKTV